MYISIYLSNYLSIYLTIELATDFSLYLDTNLQSPACIWIEDWRFHRNSFLKSSTLPICGGIDDPKKKSCGIFNLKRKRLPSVYPFHSIPSVRPSYPSTHIVHPSFPFIYIAICSPICLSTYISTNLSSYLSFDPSIYLIIYFHTTLQSLGCMWIEDPRKNNLQSKEGYRGYRQQEALRSRSHDMRVSPYSNNSNRL